MHEIFVIVYLDFKLSVFLNVGHCGPSFSRIWSSACHQPGSDFFKSREYYIIS